MGLRMKFPASPTLLTGKTYQDMIVDARKQRANEYNVLSSITLESLEAATSQSVESVRKDGPNCLAVASIIYTLIKLRKDHVILINILNSLKEEKDEQVGIFLSFVYAKLLKHTQRDFIQQKLDDCLKSLRENNALPSAYFLYFLAKHSRKSILLCNEVYLHVAIQTLYHSDPNVRYTGFESLKLYLHILDNAQSAHSPVLLLFNLARTNIEESLYSKQHGSFLIFAAIFENPPPQVEKDAEKYMDFFSKLMNKFDAIELHTLILYNLVLISSLDPQIFRKKFFNEVIGGLITICESTDRLNLASLSILNLFKQFPALFEDKDSSLLLMLNAIIFNPIEETKINGLYLLQEISVRLSSFVNRNVDQISRILNQTLVTHAYVKLITPMFHRFPKLWNVFKMPFVSKLSLELTNLQTTDILDFVAECPPLDILDITLKLKHLLKSENNKIRSKAPRALMVQLTFEDTKMVQEIISRMFTTAMSDPDQTVRASILKSFPPATNRLLTVDPYFSCFATLVKDEAFEVRNNAIQLFGQVAKLNPYDCLPVLRSLLLDSFFILDSPRPPRVKEEMTRSFDALLRAASEILPIYCTTFCDIALRQLSFTPLCELTYFEQRFIDNINLNITNAVGFIAEQDVLLIGPHIPQFVNFFIWLLQQHGPKSLKLAVVTTLYTILTGTSEIPGINMTQLFSTLTSIACKWNSRKLNVAVLKLIGFIGAIDQTVESPTDTMNNDDIVGQNHQAYFMSQACKTLLNILADDSLITHHPNATKSLVDIFCTDTSSNPRFFNEFIPLFLEQIRKQKNPDIVDLLKKMCFGAPKEWITHFATELLELLQELWNIESLLRPVLELIPILVVVLVDRLSPFVPQYTTFLIDCFYQYTRDFNVELTHSVLMALISLRHISSDYFVLIFTELVSAVLDLGHPINTFQLRAKAKIQRDTLDALRVLVQQCDCIPYASSIMRCILTCIEKYPELSRPAIMVLFSLMVRLGSLLPFFSEQIVPVLHNCKNEKLVLTQFAEIQLQIMSDPENTVIDNFPFIETNDPFTPIIETIPKLQNSEIDEQTFKRKIDPQETYETPWNWKEWYQEFVRSCIELSPSPSINACKFLIDGLFNIAESLFNAAFLSIWDVLSGETQIMVSAHFTRAFLSDALPSGAIRSSLVNLIEFMEQNECHIIISNQVLCQTCMRSTQHAKALYFVHRWFDEDPRNLEAIETLIELSSHLDLKKSIQGLSIYIKNEVDLKAEPSWCEKLGKWYDALTIYQQQPPSTKTLEGILRCLEKLQRWDDIIDHLPEINQSQPTVMREVAPIMAMALFHRQKWSELKSVLEIYPPDSVQVHVILALFQISQNKPEEARKTVEVAFNMLASNARGAFKHDKTSLYPILLTAQQLHEITEIANNNPNLEEIWDKRLSMCRQTFDVYHKLMSVHLTVYPVEEMMKPALKMIKIALNNKDHMLVDSAMNLLFPDRSKWSIEVAFLHAKCLWARNQQPAALNEIKDILKIINTGTNNPKLKAKIFYTIGQWMISMAPPGKVGTVIEAAVKFLEQSIYQKTRFYHAWNRWAWACSVMYNEHPNVTQHALNAINGFYECVILRTNNSFSELLQMISLFFTPSLDESSFKMASEKIAALNDNVLLMIIPQLFAQLSVNVRKTAQNFVGNLVIRLLPNHYHVLLYPLFLLTQSPTIPIGLPLENSLPYSANPIANQLISKFASSNALATNQAKIISDGLLLCSSTLIELWSDEIIACIRFLQKRMVSKAIETLMRAISIPDRPGSMQMNVDLLKDLKQIYQYLPEAAQNPDKINPLIKRLQQLHAKIKAYLQTVRNLKMHQYAPNLTQLRNSIIAVPGTYKISQPIVTISLFDPNLEIYNSKQRPRLLHIFGVDGSHHRSLLKGREDLRLDQRVMQFLELMNQHISHNLKNSRDMQLFTYSITPLSKTAGLIQFVDGADTMYSLINDYRRTRKINVFLEQDLVEKEGPKNTDSMMPIQRLEILNSVASQTPDSDLREIIWLTSPKCSDWVFRSVRFTQSCALMSIIGYILGLGDRHPSNLMIHRYTGSIIHIDFSDCFEVSRQRIRFPELIPFRLSRMMIRAFGPTGIEGDFRLTCQEIIELVRSHKESIMAVLDIFLQEPIDVGESDDEDEESVSNEDLGDVLISEDEVNSFGTPEKSNKTNIEDSLNRILAKITGNDFGATDQTLSPEEQVQALIVTATNQYNLANLYHGWTPLW